MLHPVVVERVRRRLVYCRQVLSLREVDGRLVTTSSATPSDDLPPLKLSGPPEPREVVPEPPGRDATEGREEAGEPGVEVDDAGLILCREASVATCTAPTRPHRVRVGVGAVRDGDGAPAHHVRERVLARWASIGPLPVIS